MQSSAVHSHLLKSWLSPRCVGPVRKCGFLFPPCQLSVLQISAKLHDAKGDTALETLILLLLPPDRPHTASPSPPLPQSHFSQPSLYSDPQLLLAAAYDLLFSSVSLCSYLLLLENLSCSTLCCFPAGCLVRLGHSACPACSAPIQSLILQ